MLGATGRAGSAIIRELPADARVVAAVRAASDSARLPGSHRSLQSAVIDLNDPDSIGPPAIEADVIINAVRLREDIGPEALIDLHETIRMAAAEDAWIVTVGGAGSLHLPGGQRFWQHPAFPAQTLPRGIAHAGLRDHLEAGASGHRWSYLIPPPRFEPDGVRTGRYVIDSAAAEPTFARTAAISYADFALATARCAMARTAGTRLVHGG